MTLECSSKGDKRFSAFYAKVQYLGNYDSIENHYQNSKGFNDNYIGERKGVKPDYVVVHNVKLSCDYLTPLYKILWVMYFETHPELVNYAKQFDNFSDMFKGKRTINCQADVIRQYMKEGKESILREENVKEFLRIIKTLK